MVLGVLAGCGSSNKAGRVYWLNFKPESDEVLQNVAKMYTEKTGVEVKVVTAANGTYQQQLTSEMAKSEAPTLFVIGNQEGVKSWGEYAMDLKGSAIANELNTDAYNLYDESGKLVSIGYCFECYGIIVNPDLVAAAGHTMDEIKNFEGLKAVAEDIHARAAELGFDAFSSSDMDGSSSWRFTGHMANLEYYYEQEGQTWTECPSSLTGKYMENFKNLYDLCINNSLTDPSELATGGHDAENEFKTGKAAFFVNGSWEYGAVSETVPNATMIPYYCGVAGEEKAGLNCGTENCWAINDKVSDADKKATMDFMVWCVTDPEVSRLLVDSFGTSILMETKYGFWGLIILMCWQQIGYMMIIYIAGLQNVPGDMLEAATTDGAAKTQTLFKVTIPNVMPSITICMFLSLTNGFKLFDQNLALTGGLPFLQQADGSVVKTTEMLALNIYNTFYTSNATAQGTAQAKAVIFFILVAGLGLAQLAYTRKREVQQ